MKNVRVAGHWAEILTFQTQSEFANNSAETLGEGYI